MSYDILFKLYTISPRTNLIKDTPKMKTFFSPFASTPSNLNPTFPPQS